MEFIFYTVLSCWSTIVNCIVFAVRNLWIGKSDLLLKVKKVNEKPPPLLLPPPPTPAKKRKGWREKWAHAASPLCSVYPAIPFGGKNKVMFLLIFKLYDYETQSTSTRNSFLPSLTTDDLRLVNQSPWASGTSSLKGGNINSTHFLRWLFCTNTHEQFTHSL